MLILVRIPCCTCRVVLLALAFVMLDVMLMCIVFHAERRGDRLMQCFVVGSHLAASFATLFNQVEEGCTISLPLLVLVVLVTVLALNRYGATMH